MRQHLATKVYQEGDYFTKQQKQQTIKLQGCLSEHIDKILEVLRPHTLRDIETIKKLTGEPDVRYFDLAYLKERVKGILLSRDPNNIQMLTCFTLQNVIKGLMIMAAEVFGQEIDLKTIIITITDNDIKIDESRGFNLT